MKFLIKRTDNRYWSGSSWGARDNARSYEDGSFPETLNSMESVDEMSWGWDGEPWAVAEPEEQCTRADGYGVDSTEDENGPDLLPPCDYDFGAGCGYGIGCIAHRDVKEACKHWDGKS
jgi:hypothetical protein|tara:strand:+ start:3522 stop:3875 length:354 start_codon:yes stop_codon:yes gene_type:complete